MFEVYNVCLEQNVENNFHLFRSCSGLVVINYIKSNYNDKDWFEVNIANSIIQYKAFKKNFKLKFDSDDRPEVNGEL